MTKGIGCHYETPLRTFLLCLFVCFLPTVCQAEQYALLIGIDKYDTKELDVDGGVADVRGLADTLQTRCGYRAENIQVLAGEGKTQVTRQAILNVVAQMAKRVHPDDTVFFWSGHGGYLNGEDCVQPYDTDARDQVEYERNALTVNEMLLPLRRTPCKALLVFFNIGGAVILRRVAENTQHRERDSEIRMLQKVE